MCSAKKTRLNPYDHSYPGGGFLTIQKKEFLKTPRGGTFLKSSARGA